MIQTWGANVSGRGGEKKGDSGPITAVTTRIQSKVGSF